MSKIKVYTDGASRGNPGESGIGVTVGAAAGFGEDGVGCFANALVGVGDTSLPSPDPESSQYIVETIRRENRKKRFIAGRLHNEMRNLFACVSILPTRGRFVVYRAGDCAADFWNRKETDRSIGLWTVLGYERIKPSRGRV